MANPPSFASTVEEVLAEVEKVAGESGLRTALVGFALVDLEADPGTVAGYRMDDGLVPASTMKAITTAVANEVLGPDFRFVTRLETTGEVDPEGVLKGDLIIRGGGDPTLAATEFSPTFSKWKAALAAVGIRSIEGRVIGDASIFGTALTPDTWQWNDLGNYYGAGACGLTVHQNLFYANFRTPSVGARAPFTGTTPKLPDHEFYNEMRVGAPGSGDQGYVYADPYGKLVTFRGTVPSGSGDFTIKGALPDPALFCARSFSEYLNESGLSVSGGASTDRLLAMAGEETGARKVIHEQSSEPLSSLLVTTNHKSDNLKAECIHRAIGVKVSGRGTTESAVAAVREYWEEKGIDLTGFTMGDGCGLSRANTVTPRQMALMLHAASKGEHFETFRASLPVAGRSGTLKSIGSGSSAEGRIRAKSGTMDRIRNYAGYLEARSGKRYAFSFFVTNYATDLASVKSKIVRVWSVMAGL
ncbi:MAG: D-alanyl-D-alanine carboxypeptidase/D-alanyl-D-alanine-endopeptidase [Verrucomicrobiae bacterium]|nr:D-alanyl-D-alanine carboxypeptidase/D-alanyl-D-alanine-endopeptidase [Verrucomicrobiae bacterium]